MINGNRARAEPGMFTVEFAIVTPIFVLLGFVLTSMIVSGWQQVGVSNEAKEIAREISIQGQSSLVTQAQSTGAKVEVSFDKDVVTVTVQRKGRGLYSWLDMDYTGTYRVVMEPGTARVAAGGGDG